jgi:epoxyqueuosine reductase
MKEEIRRQALALGFDACRFAAATPPDHAEAFSRWLAAGHHGEMDWMKRNAHKRLDPRQVLAGARTVVALAASYPASDDTPAPPDPRQGAPISPISPIAPITPITPTDGTPSPPDPEPGPAGLVARYARGPDYHQALGTPLKTLAQWIDARGGTGVRSLWYVDTGPILERDLAQRAGLGFTGKHTNLIGRGLGNWFFLAEILTTLELPPDLPEKNRCGSCVKCLAACPTQAIRAPFELDARRCISYLTIELKGSIPVELRPALGNRIFGCDDCLAVCPWNRFAREGSLMRGPSAARPARLGLRALLRLDESEFKLRFTGTPIERVKRRGLLRNVCVALGNTGSRDDLPDLDRARRDGEPLVAEHAAWAVEQIEARPGVAK